MNSAREPNHHRDLAYRADVDGLRAVAVVCVVIYHAFPALLPGGFVGVDIFFVISGFLITGTMLSDFQRGRFTFASFYSRRVRRIFPALIVVLAACFLAGIVLLLPREFAQLGRQQAFGAIFLSNIELYREIGYFDTAAELKPLLHLWSLGVEEQYYVVWPVAMYLMRRRLHWLWMVIAAIAAASFALNAANIGAHPAAAFYLPFTRMWELMMGSALAYIQYRTAAQFSAAGRGESTGSKPDSMFARHAISVAGVVLLGLAFAFIDAKREFPGWWALLPTVGSAALICAGPRAWANRRILSISWFVRVGVVSYPLYLWHWPLLAFARIVFGAPSVSMTLGLLAASLALAWLTYRGLELPVRAHSRGPQGRLTVRIAVGCMAFLGSLGLLSAHAVVLPASGSSVLAGKVEAAASDWIQTVDVRVHGKSDRTILFFGDSHTQQYAPRYVGNDRSVRRLTESVEFVTRGGCAPVPGIERWGGECAPFVKRGFDRARMPDVDTVIIAASWYGFVTRDDIRPESQVGGLPIDVLSRENEWIFDGFEQALASLVKQGKKVVIVLSSPRGDVLDPRTFLRRSIRGVEERKVEPLRLDEFKALVAPVDSRIAAIAARIGATVVDPSQLLCTSSVCPALDSAGQFIYGDASHIRASFVRANFDLLDPFVFVSADEPRPGAPRRSPLPGGQPGERRVVGRE